MSSDFIPLKQRDIRARFDGGAITTEGGGLQLRGVEKRVGIVRQFAACFRDYRDPDRIEHTVEEWLARGCMVSTKCFVVIALEDK